MPTRSIEKPIDPDRNRFRFRSRFRFGLVRFPSRRKHFRPPFPQSLPTKHARSLVFLLVSSPLLCTLRTLPSDVCQAANLSLSWIRYTAHLHSWICLLDIPLQLSQLPLYVRNACGRGLMGQAPKVSTFARVRWLFRQDAPTAASASRSGESVRSVANLLAN